MCRLGANLSGKNKHKLLFLRALGLKGMGSQITESSIVCLTVVQEGNIKAPHYWPFVKGKHRWQWSVYSPHKEGPVMGKTFSFNEVTMANGWCNKSLYSTTVNDTHGVSPSLYIHALSIKSFTHWPLGSCGNNFKIVVYRSHAYYD